MRKTQAILLFLTLFVIVGCDNDNDTTNDPLKTAAFCDVYTDALLCTNPDAQEEDIVLDMFEIVWNKIESEDTSFCQYFFTQSNINDCETDAASMVVELTDFTVSDFEANAINDTGQYQFFINEYTLGNNLIFSVYFENNENGYKINHWELVDDGIGEFVDTTVLGEVSVRNMLNSMYTDFYSDNFECEKYYSTTNFSLGTCQQGMYSSTLTSLPEVDDVDLIYVADDQYLVIPLHDFGGTRGVRPIYSVYLIDVVLEDNFVKLAKRVGTSPPLYENLNGTFYDTISPAVDLMLDDLQNNDIDNSMFCDMYRVHMDDCELMRQYIFDNIDKIDTDIIPFDISNNKQPIFHLRISVETEVYLFEIYVQPLDGYHVTENEILYMFLIE